MISPCRDCGKARLRRVEDKMDFVENSPGECENSGRFSDVYDLFIDDRNIHSDVYFKDED